METTAPNKEITLDIEGMTCTNCAAGISNYLNKQDVKELLLIEQLAKKAPTAMVGDGINDAPALAKEYVGISLGNATEVAVDCAQVTLLNGRLSYLKSALILSNLTIKTIKQNLFWTFSDVIVVGNSLRLRLKKID